MSKLTARYYRMVCKKAWQFWTKLPPQTRAWISIDDLIQDGLCRLLDLHRQRWDSKRGSFSTLLWLTLENHYKSYLQYWFMQKRFDGRTQSLSLSLTEGATLDSEVRMQQDVILADQFEKLYGLASAELRPLLLRIARGDGQFRRQKLDGVRREFLLLTRLLGIRRDDVLLWARTQNWKAVLPEPLFCKLYVVADVGQRR